jgi:hypothetical protein
MTKVDGEVAGRAGVEHETGEVSTVDTEDTEGTTTGVGGVSVSPDDPLVTSS